MKTVQYDWFEGASKGFSKVGLRNVNHGLVLFQESFTVQVVGNDGETEIVLYVG